MAQRNLEVVRETIRRFTARDFAGLSEMYAPDAAIEGPEGWPEGGRFEGRDASIRQFEHLARDWEDQTMTAGRELAAGDWVVVELHWRAQGAASGIGFDMDLTGAYRLDDAGKVAEARFFWTWEEGLRAAGIAE